MTDNQGLAAVLPLKVERSKTDSFGQVRFLFQSLLKYSTPDLFDVFYIIVPSNSVEMTEKMCGEYASINFKVIDEEKLTRGLKPWISGWRKQQLIKLGMAELIEESFYMTFDADVILTKPITRQTLLPNGKALLQYIKKKNRAHWWTSSAEILDVDPLLDELGMGTTPAILRTEWVRELLQHLSEIGNDDWMKYLTASYKYPLFEFIFKPIKWTEYSLYHLYIRHNKDLEEYHHICYPDSDLKVVCKNSVWNAVKFEEWDPESVFDRNDSGLFCIIQSNKNLPIESIETKLLPYLT